MKFESYPHDTQICSMMIESREYITNNIVTRVSAIRDMVYAGDLIGKTRVRICEPRTYHQLYNTNRSQ